MSREAFVRIHFKVIFDTLAAYDYVAFIGDGLM